MLYINDLCECSWLCFYSITYFNDMYVFFFCFCFLFLIFTCPLDNWLIIFQALVKSNKVKLEDLPESGHILGTALRLINDGLYVDAKLLILQSLPQQQRGM